MPLSQITKIRGILKYADERGKTGLTMTLKVEKNGSATLAKVVVAAYREGPMLPVVETLVKEPDFINPAGKKIRGRTLLRADASELALWLKEHNSDTKLLVYHSIRTTPEGDRVASLVCNFGIDEKMSEGLSNEYRPFAKHPLSALLGPKGGKFKEYYVRLGRSVGRFVAQHVEGEGFPLAQYTGDHTKNLKRVEAIVTNYRPTKEEEVPAFVVLLKELNLMLGITHPTGETLEGLH